MKKSEWQEFGDVNPLDYSGVWIRKWDTNEYEIVSVNNLEWASAEKGYLLQECIIDITDNWIDMDSVRDYTIDTEQDAFNVAYDVFIYYGALECNGIELTVYSRRGAREFINDHGIVIHRNGGVK